MLITIFLTVTTIISLVLFFFERSRRLKLERQTPDLALEEARKKTLDILNQASLKAQAILGQSVQTEMQITKMQQTQEKALTNALDKKFEEVFKAYTEYLASLRDKTTQSLTQQTGAVFERFEQNLSDFLVQTQQKSTHAVELEMQAARNLIENYKRQQLNLIDEQIVEVLERTLSLVLTKKLTLEDQVDLINEALQKAKVEKFII